MQNRTSPLWRAYRTSFERFASQAADLAAYDDNADDTALDCWQELEQARAAHARARDALVVALLSPARRVSSEETGEESHVSVVCSGV